MRRCDSATRARERRDAPCVVGCWPRVVLGQQLLWQSIGERFPGHFVSSRCAIDQCGRGNHAVAGACNRIDSHGERAGRRGSGNDGRCNLQAAGEGPHQERRGCEAGWRGQLWSRDLLGGHEEEDPVTLSGVGLGLRWEFLDELMEASAAGSLPVDFLEVSPENYMKRGGRYPSSLASLAERLPIVTHGLTMSLGGVDPLDGAYLRDLAAFLHETKTPWHSDHLCFGAVDHRVLHDLLPLAFTRATVERVAERIRRARDAIQLPLAVENISYYWHPGRAEMGEPELLTRVCDLADCGLMLDVNNAYVNAVNFGLDPDAWLREAPLDRVVQIHVAGHEWFAVDAGGLGEPAAAHASDAMIIDTHGADVPDPVLLLLERALARTGPVPVVLERDQNVPPLDVLLDELGRIRAIWSRAASTPVSRR
jgi:uncharacterized protein (UPF0276 family)